MNSSDERWARIQELFHQAVEMPAPERDPFLAQACADAAMLAEVRSMVASAGIGHEGGSGPLPNGGLAGMATVLEGDPDEIQTGESGAGHELGPYVLTRLLGEGGSGRVYLARRADVGSVVAIKVLRDAWVSAARRVRFADEQRIVAQLRHPLVASLYDAGVTADGTPYFVMEHVDGLPLTQACAERGCGLRERLEIFAKVCEAVRYSHSQAIAHRDLKPSNILVTADGGVKLLDFGIAKQMEAADQTNAYSRTGFRLMTPAYASPEQWLGKRPGLQADIYSLGAVLYELLAGCPPFDLKNATPSEAERLVTQQAPPAPSAAARKAGLSAAASAKKSEWADLDVICLKALQKEPERRYATVDALLGDVRAFLDGEPVAARPDSWRYRTGKFLRRNRTAAVATAAVLLVIAGLSGGFVWRLNRERQTALAEAERAERMLQFTLNLFSGGQSDVRDEAGGGPRAGMLVSELIEKSARQVRTLSGEPLEQSEMFMTIGQVYEQMGDLGKAEENIKAAWMVRKQLPGNEAAALAAQSQVILGRVLSEQDRHEEADRDIRQGLAILEHLKGAGDPAVLEAKVVHANEAMASGSYDAAVRTLESVVRAQQTGASSNEDRASAASSLSMAYYLTGDFARAEPAINSALSIERAAYGPVHPSIAEGEQWLCQIKRDKDELSDAEQHCRNAFLIDNEWYGPDSIMTAATMRALGAVLTRENKLKEGMPLLERALSIAESKKGDSSQAVAVILTNLCENAYRSGNYAIAAQYGEHSIRILRALVGTEHNFSVAVNEALLAGIANKQNDNTRAEPLMRQALATFHDIQGPEGMKTAAAHVQLGHILLCEGKYVEAKQETQLGSDILFKHTLPQGEFFEMAKSDLAEENAKLGGSGALASAERR